jgi:hypothetical protein
MAASSAEPVVKQTLEGFVNVARVASGAGGSCVAWLQMGGCAAPHLRR